MRKERTVNRKRYKKSRLTTKGIVGQYTRQRRKETRKKDKKRRKKHKKRRKTKAEHKKNQSDVTRTRDLLFPKQIHYQTMLHSDKKKVEEEPKESPNGTSPQRSDP